MGESLRAQLLATLDLMPTLAWYATPSGGSSGHLVTSSPRMRGDK